MQTATAQLNTYRQSPRKVRLLADLVRGKKVDQALTTLRFATKRGAGPIVALIESALANAKNLGMNTDVLIVSQITVNGGQILKRSMPMSRGRAFPIKKRTSHIHVALSEKIEKAVRGKEGKEAARAGEAEKASAEKAENKPVKAKAVKAASKTKK